MAIKINNHINSPHSRYSLDQRITKRNSPNSALIFLFILLAALTVLCLQLRAQDFEPVPQANLPGLYSGDIDWGDYDNDGDLDILLMGNRGEELYYDIKPLTGIYTNKGGGKFAELTKVQLPQLYKGSAKWGDYDNDGDLDILLTGNDKNTEGENFVNNKGVAAIYVNKGYGVFSELKSARLTGFANSAADWGDYDNDGDLDIAITGYMAGKKVATKIYSNNGDDTFSELPVDLPGTTNGALSWVDHDSDGDLDLFVSSRGIFSNNGNGTFGNRVATELPPVDDASVDWGDFDNDGDADLLLTGLVEYSASTEIYVNNGGSFTRLTGHGLVEQWQGDGKWGDYDNDGDLDVVLTGDRGGHVFSNNGDGTFTEAVSELLHATNSMSASGDYDNDGDLDLLMAGYGGETEPGSLIRLYNNRTQQPNTPPAMPGGLTAVVSGNTVTLKWNPARDNQTPSEALSYEVMVEVVDGATVTTPHTHIATGYRRVVTVGKAQQGTTLTLRNLPAGLYHWSVQAIDHTFAGSLFAPKQRFTIASKQPVITDVSTWQGKAGEFVMLKGINFTNVSEVSFNGVKAQFNLINNRSIRATIPAKATSGKITVVTDRGTATSAFDFKIVLPPLFVDVTPKELFRGIEIIKDVEWGDCDNDNDLDLVVTGFNVMPGNYRVGVAKVYLNYGRGNFGEAVTMEGGDMATWGDYDNDGNLDLAIAGVGVFRNRGMGRFNNEPDYKIHPEHGTVSWSDHDNDGDLDLLVTGRVYNPDIEDYMDVSEVHLNTGKGNLVMQEWAGIDNIVASAATWADYDNDDDMDLLMIVKDGFSWYDPLTRLYRNDGGILNKVTDSGLENLKESSIDWGDYDQDGDLDILVTGQDYDGAGVTRVYKNTGNGKFVTLPAALPPLMTGSAQWGDYDHDGDLDILLSGYRNRYYNREFNTAIYRNNGQGNFSEEPLHGLPAASGPAAWGDYDKDGDLDILLTGEMYDEDKGWITISRLFQNRTPVVNMPPAAPTGLSAEVSSSRVLLKWQPASDDHTLASGLSYNVRIGTSPNGVQKVSPHANPTRGIRRKVEPGNAQQGTSFEVAPNTLPPGVYYWSVQAIDNSFAGSAFAAEGTFEIGALCKTPLMPETSEITQTSAKLSWAASGDNKHYSVQYRRLNTTDWKTVNTTATSVVIRNLVPGFEYEWRVKNVCATSPLSESPFTQRIIFDTERCGSIEAVQVSKLTSTSVTLSWSALPLSHYYQIDYEDYDDFSGGKTVTTTATSITLTDLQPGKNYVFYLRNLCVLDPLSYSYTYTLWLETPPATVAVSAAGRAEARVEERKLQVYPNPSAEVVNIRMPAGDTTAEVYIYNATGALVHTQKVENTTGEFSIACKTQGIYTARVIVDGRIFIERFVIQ